jgi:NTP pyrophosphatase (non-canonical NTP hydrolase)
MADLQKLTDHIIKFRNLRDWKQFHNPKDIALSLMLEAAEVGEHFQWKRESEIVAYVEENREAIAEELSDVLYWILLLSHDLGIDLFQAFKKKMAKNELKYPVAKAKGKHTKYTKL